MSILRPAAVAAVTTALVLGIATPAFAATVEWAGPPAGGNQETSEPANWVGGAVPAAGGDWSFPAGNYAHNSLPVDTLVGGLRFSSPGFLLAGTRFQLGAQGVDAQASAETNADITLTGSQTWSVAAGSTLLNRGEILVTTGELELAPLGTIEFRGRLDGVGGAGAVTQSSGTVILSGSGGTIGAGGYRVVGGTSHWAAVLGGTAVQVADPSGVMSGDGAAQRITAIAGTISPGPVAGGAGIAELESWDTVSLSSAASLLLDVDATSSDTLKAYRGIDLGGALLQVRVADGVAPVERTTIATSTEGAIEPSLATALGPIVLGESFVSGGHRWRLEQPDPATLDLVWIERVAVVTPPVDAGPTTPLVPAPTAPARPALAATGAVDLTAPAAAGFVLTVMGALLIAARSRRRSA